MKSLSAGARRAVIGAFTGAVVVTGAVTALSASAVNAQIARIWAANRALVEQPLKRLSRDQHSAVLRAYQSALHPAWTEMSTPERLVEAAQLASRLLSASTEAAAELSLPTPANFYGNRTVVSTTEEGFGLRRESDCSLTMHVGSFTFGGSVSNALALTPGPVTTHYEQTLHDAAGLTTTAGAFAGGCNDKRPGFGSRRAVYLGKATNDLLVFAGTGYYPQDDVDALWFGAVDPPSSAMATFKIDASLPDLSTVAAGDLNGDGMDDIVGVAALSPTISVWTVSTAGALGTSTPYTVPGTQGEAVVVADFNGDGKADVVAASQDAQAHEQVSVFTGKGDGTLNAPTSFSVPTPTGFASTHIATLVAADLRGNGHQDLIASNGTVLLGNGDGTFGAATAAFPVTVATSSYGPNLVVADLNKDGKADVAVSGGENVNIYFGNGDGTFTAAGSYASIDDVGYLSASDLDGDGNVDLYVGLANGGVFGGDQFSTGRAYALMGKGDGTFLGAPTLPFVYTGTNLADVSGDGIADGVGVNSDASLTAYLGDAAGHFTQSAHIATSPAVVNGSPLTFSDIESLSLGDVTGEGNLDIVYIGIAQNQGPYLFFSAGDGHGGFAAPTAITPPTFVPPGDFDISPKVFNVRLADVNGDSKLDLVYGYSDASVNTNLFAVGNAVQLGNGNGTFGAPKLIPFYSNVAVTSLTSKVVQIADINKDTHPDLVLITQTSVVSQTISSLVSHMQVALGHGDGTFGTPTDVAGPDLMTSTFPGLPYAPIQLGDMNGDGTLDLVALGSSSTGSLQAAVSIGNGDGTFKTPALRSYSDQFLSHQGLALADFDGDGKLDIAITDPFGLYSSGIALGNGDGTLQFTGDPTRSYTNFNFVIAIGGATTALDLNGDGKPDIIAGPTELLSQGAVGSGGGGGGGGGGSTPDFAISASAMSGTVSAGASVNTTITLTPSGGFNQSVALTCSGLPAGATCTFSPATATVNGSAATSTLTIATAARTAMNIMPGSSPLLPAGTVLASLLAPFVIRRRAQHSAAIASSLLTLVLASALVLGGCGGGGSDSGSNGGGSSGGTSGTPAGSYTVTVTATAGSTSHALSYTLTVS